MLAYCGRPAVSRILVLAALILVACTSVPDQVSSRPSLPPCGNGDIYAPPAQGPDVREEESIAALECFAEANLNGEAAELEYVSLDAEGRENQAILQTHQDRSVDFFRESETGWQISVGCGTFRIDPPGIPVVDDCTSSNG